MEKFLEINGGPSSSGWGWLAVGRGWPQPTVSNKKGNKTNKTRARWSIFELKIIKISIAPKLKNNNCVLSAKNITGFLNR